ncbi:MAG: DUF4340 domain-containing protein, partial [bacterium]|nr:DUF4340 domain-containing protein [bacterium]
ASEINSLMGKVHSESIFEYVAETLENPAVYGLDNPEYVFSVIYADGKARTLSLGASETGSRTRLLYAHSSERPYVFLIEPFLTDFLDVQVSDLRYKRVFEFEREGVDRIQLAYPDSTVTCLLENGDWVVSQPPGFMANAVAIGHWIDKVHTMAVQDFVGPVAHPADFGLSNPILTVSLWRGSALKREVRIGGQNGTWYGLMTGSDEVFVFDPGIIPGLHLPLESAPGAAVRLGAE